jgi:DNA-binding IclR family transcriptional regulator
MNPGPSRYVPQARGRPDQPSAQSRKRSVMSTSVVRAARILDRLAHSQTPMTLAEIASELDIPKSTAYTILRDLASESFVTVSSPPAYWIGLKAFEVGSAHLRASGTAGAVAPELARLTRALNITSHYAVLDGTEVLYLCKEDPPTLGIQLASAVGARLPSHLTAVGKACLAWLEADCLPGHVELATSGADGQTISLSDLTAELAQVRMQGFAADDGAAAAGIQSVAAPVFGLTGLKGAIGVSLVRGSVPSLDPVADDVKTAAASATIALGGTTPDHHVLPRNDHADQTSVGRW